MVVRSGVVGLLAMVVLGVPVLAGMAVGSVPVAAEVPPDQERLVVFELFTAPAASG